MQTPNTWATSRLAPMCMRAERQRAEARCGSPGDTMPNELKDDLELEAKCVTPVPTRRPPCARARLAELGIHHASPGLLVEHPAVSIDLKAQGGA